MFVISHPISSRLVAGAGMVKSLVMETREILLPSLDTVHGDCGAGELTPRDHHCVSVRVRDGAGFAVTNIVHA